jgi:hypothetical protein
MSKQRRGRPSARDIVRQTLAQMRTEGLSLHEPFTRLAKMVAARNNRTLADRSWGEKTIWKHIIEWLREHPDDANDYRIALTLKEAARASGLSRSLLFVAVGRGTLRAQKCGARTLILHSDLQRFVLTLRTSPRGRVSTS